MEIIAPHEPRPLKREFRQRYGEGFSWTVVEHEQSRCRVRITKGTEQPSTQDSENAEPPSRPPTKDLTVTAELDVRDLPPAQRHEQIFEAYAELDSKEAFVLVNDHDPKPLYHQFEAEAGDEFRWEYQQQQPGEFMVLVGKEPTADSETESSSSTKEDPEAPF